MKFIRHKGSASRPTIHAEDVYTLIISLKMIFNFFSLNVQILSEFTKFVNY